MKLVFWSKGVNCEVKPRVGSVVYATDQGLAMLGKSFWDAGVVQEVMIYRHGTYTNHFDRYPPGTMVVSGKRIRGREVDYFLRSIDVVLFFETPFDWSFPDYCRTRGVKTVLMPMHEWTPRHLPHKFDLMLCPSLLDLDYFPGGKFLPVPVDPSHWKLRTHARRWLHNAGHIGHREHKGTRQLLEAVQYVKHPEWQLTVRAQDKAVSGLKSILKDNPHVERDRRVTIEFGDRPYDTLWDDHDVLIAPEKLNGLSLPLSEGCAAGMLVMTTDRYPANTWLPKEPLIPVARYQKAQVSRGCLEFDEAVVEPQTIAATIDAWYGREITAFSEAGLAWAKETSWEALKPKYEAIFNEVAG